MSSDFAVTHPRHSLVTAFRTGIQWSARSHFDVRHCHSPITELWYWV